MLPKLKVKVETVIDGYLNNELTDEEFKDKIQLILDEFHGKNLLHQNIGQLTLRREDENPRKKHQFRGIWRLLDEVSPRIRKDTVARMGRPT